MEREASSIAASDTEFKEFVRFCSETRRSVLEMKVRAIVSLLIWRFKFGVSENLMS